MPLARFGLVWIIAWFTYAPFAAAQPMTDVAVIPYGTPDVDAALEAVSVLEADLAEEHVSVISRHDARDRFTARSRSPQTPSDSDLEALAKAANDAIEHVAFGRTAAAQRSVREVITRADRTLESLNRETTTARHILDACLSLVRSALQSGKRDVAIEQATRCRRMVPDLLPSENTHPASVVGVLMEADNLLRRMQIGQLTVTSAPQSGCSVYLNGRHLGTTPFLLERAAAGDYRVQVECSRAPGRVHMVQLGDEPVSLLVDTRFDRAVANEPRLLLHYENQQEAREHVVAHAVQLGREIGATDVVLMNVDGGQCELLRIVVRQQRLVARAVVPWTDGQRPARSVSKRALAALAEARLEDEPSAQTRTDNPIPAPEATVVTSDPAGTLNAPALSRGEANPALQSEVVTGAVAKRGSWRLWTAGTLAVVGAAATIGGALLLRARFEDGQRVAAEPRSLALRRDWDSERLPPRILGGVGAAVMAAGLIVAGTSLDLRRHSWIPIVTSVLGAGMLTAGATVYAAGGVCTTERYTSPSCVSNEHRTDRGYQVLMGAVPLLAFSSFQLSRWLLPHSRLGVSIAPSQLALAGRF